MTFYWPFTCTYGGQIALRWNMHTHRSSFLWQLPGLRIHIDSHSFALLDPFSAVSWIYTSIFRKGQFKHLLWENVSLNISKQYHLIFFSQEKNDYFFSIVKIVKNSRTYKMILHFAECCILTLWIRIWVQRFSKLLDLNPLKWIRILTTGLRPSK